MQSQAIILDKFDHQLDVIDFIKESGFQMEQIYIDRFWSSIKDDKWIYVGNELLEWIGYSAARDRQSKEQYLQLIIKHFQREHDYKQFSALEAKQFYVVHIDDIELPNDFNHHNKVKHLLVSPDCFKESLMLLATTRAKEIR